MFPMTHAQATINGIRLHYVEAGVGPLVVLLHGFPEFWYSWRHQLPALAGAGFHAVAPDLRGYNESDRPAGVRSYRLHLLVDDVAELIAHLGERRATVVGHDWGGVIAWTLAMHRLDLVERLAILNAPHPAAFRRELRRKPAQWLRSAYMLFFQLPWLPEWMLAAADYALVRRLLRRDPVRPGAFTAEDITRYRDALAWPGARTAALNYYRALLGKDQNAFAEVSPVLAPTLLVWGERDRYLGVGLTEGLDQWVPDLRVARLPHASHWVQNDAPDDVNRLLLGFIQSDPEG
jgi:pimeloyl-ACP methyl ester carboxylesterase